MHLLQAVLMGIVQGLSEFLPISSSAHLVLTSNFYKVINNIDISNPSSQEVFFDIMLHLGTLVAVLIFFRKEILSILNAFIQGLIKKDYSSNDFKLGVYIILGTIITVAIAYPLSELCAKLVFRPDVVGILLIITGIILLISEHFSKKIVNKSNITLKKSILIGIAQGLACFPGFSRSGLTIATGLFAGLDRTTAAKYSFLLSIPIIMGASMVYPFLEVEVQDIASYNWLAIIVGTLISALVGYLCIKYFMRFLSKFSLAVFGYYCLLLGVFAFMFFS